VKRDFLREISFKYFCLHVDARRIYEEESNENLKRSIKIRNTARLSCKLTTMILMVLRVADRRKNDAGMQHDGAVVV